MSDRVVVDWGRPVARYCGNRLADVTELADEIASSRFVADATVARGGVRAETGSGRLLYDPREVLERICAEVRREASS